MAYAKPFIDFTWGGSYFTDDIWVNGLHIIDDSNSPLDNLSEIMNETALGNISTAVYNAHIDEDGNSEHAFLSWVKFAMIGTDGKYLIDPILVDIVPVAGGRAGNMFPQLATAISLRTARRRGPAAYGRYYAPFALPVGPNGRSVGTDVDAALALQNAMIIDINERIDAFSTFDLLAVGNVSKVAPGYQERVTGTFVGDLTDTQRRRRNKLQEVYKGLSV